MSEIVSLVAQVSVASTYHCVKFQSLAAGTCRPLNMPALTLVELSNACDRPF